MYCNDVKQARLDAACTFDERFLNSMNNLKHTRFNPQSLLAYF